MHRLLEWVPLEDVDGARAERVRAMAVALAPSFGLDAEAAAPRRRAGGAVLSTAAHRPRAAREHACGASCSLWFPDGAHLVEGIVDLVFEEDGQLVVVDYKSDAIADEQALDQAAHHAPQLQLYGRGLRRRSGLPVRERLVALHRPRPERSCLAGCVRSVSCVLL